mgnify:CR=1 FL=1
MMGHFQQLFTLLETPLNDGLKFLQAGAVLVACVMAIYYQLRAMIGNPQEDQMHSQKTKKVFISLAFIFIIPTLINIVEKYFLKP